MQMEHEKCLEIMFHCYAQVEPTLICMSKKMEQAWEKTYNLESVTGLATEIQRQF